MSPVNNDTVVSEFARYLKLKNFTAKTIEHRLGQIARLARWLGETSLLEATPEQLEAWQGSLRVCPSSIQTFKFHACNYFGMSAKLLLIEARLGGRRLPELVGARRAQGKSWQGIANEIHDMTGVAVSRESLRAWCNQSKAVAS